MAEVPEYNLAKLVVFLSVRPDELYRRRSLDGDLQFDDNECHHWKSGRILDSPG